jgi:hypothetical protein
MVLVLIGSDTKCKEWRSLDELDLLGSISELGRLEVASGRMARSLRKSMVRFRRAVGIFRRRHLLWVVPCFNVMAFKWRG